MQAEPRDFVDAVVERWHSEWPELDTGPIEVLDRLLRSSQVLTKRLNGVCRTSGIELWAFAVLTALRRAGAPHQLSPTELYRAGMVTSGAMTKRLRELAAAGLIERVPSEHDGRSVEVRLTRRGRKLVDALIPEYLAAQESVLAGFTVDERRELARLLRQLLFTLEGRRTPYAAPRDAAPSDASLAN